MHEEVTAAGRQIDGWLDGPAAPWWSWRESANQFGGRWTFNVCPNFQQSPNNQQPSTQLRYLFTHPSNHPLTPTPNNGHTSIFRLMCPNQTRSPQWPPRIIIIIGEWRPTGYNNNSIAVVNDDNDGYCDSIYQCPWGNSHYRWKLLQKLQGICLFSHTHCMIMRLLHYMSLYWFLAPTASSSCRL